MSSGKHFRKRNEYKSAILFLCIKDQGGMELKTW